MAGKKKQEKTRCPDCGGTGLRDLDKGSTCCDCPAGRARDGAEAGLDYFD